jgi:uncharacterized iron-regulated membrane protein
MRFRPHPQPQALTFCGFILYFSQKPYCGRPIVLKAYALRFHRSITLLFAIPLIIVIVTGLILSVEPLAQRAKLDNPLSKQDVLGYLAEHDPESRATGLSLRAYEQTLTIAGVGEDGETEIDLRSGEVVEDDNGWSMSEVFRTLRRMHETLLLNLGWLVTASTFAMLAIAALGLILGLPKLRNTLGGWHRVAAWSVLPLVIICPLTGLAIVYGVTFVAPSGGLRSTSATVKQAVEILAEKHDLANLSSLRPRGGRMTARVYTENGLTGYHVTPTGLMQLPRNWPRAIHEGNWSPVLASVLNIIASIAFLGLWTTGLTIWARRRLRLRRRLIDVASGVPKPIA